MRFLFLSITIATILVSCNNQADKRLDVFSNYYDAIQKRSDDKWNFATDTVKLWFDQKEGDPVLQIKGQGSTGKWKEWDEEMKSTSVYDSLWFDEADGAVKGFFQENNEFYRLIGKSPTKTLRTYWFNENDKIHEILIYWIPEVNTTTGDHMAPIVEWAMKNDSLEIQELYPEGRLVPSKENAIRWKKLLTKYNEAKRH